jgi:hypothetical protein
MYKEDELHPFCSKRTMGHAAVNRFDRGYKRLQEGRIDEFLKQSTAYADILAEIQSSKTALSLPNMSPTTHADTPLQAINAQANVSDPSVAQLGSSGFQGGISTTDTQDQSADEDEDDHSTVASSSQATSKSGNAPDSDNDSDSDKDSDTDRSEECLVSGRNRALYSKFETGDVDSASDSGSEVAARSAEDDDEEDSEDDEDKVSEEGDKISEDEEASSEDIFS